MWFYTACVALSNLVAEMTARNMSYKELSELMGKEQSHITRKMCGRIFFTDFDKPIEYLKREN